MTPSPQQETPMSFRPMFEFSSGEVAGNAQRFATFDEANRSAMDHFSRWMMPTGFFVEESADPVNYRWDEARGDVSVEGESG